MTRISRERSERRGEAGGRAENQIVFDAFSVTLPSGWASVVDEATYSDPDQLPPVTFAGPDRVGTLHVAMPLFPADEQPGASAEDAEALAAEWAAGRGLTSPLQAAKDADEHGGIATALYRLADDLVQVWFLTNGDAVLAVSYVCPWSHRDVERAARDAIVASLRFT